MTKGPKDPTASEDTDGTRVPVSSRPTGTTREVPAGNKPTETIGPYRLLQLAGEGGMGEVWVAEQSHPVRRRVALKVIKAGMDTAQVVARFAAERQTLAMMDHPAIARVFDAGATPQGRPYFVMEYVRGEAITFYCSRNKLTIADRIDLFLHVCEGVQHAHQKGVIHRDLKPSNVLVTLQDGRPVPKIIDFGIAKATTQTLIEGDLYTEVGAFLGTPEYMSPEQAEMTGLDVDTRTDVYALGVILYELLCGALPFESRTLRAKGLDEIRRVIREVNPERPSTRVTALSVSKDAANHLRAEAPRLVSQLRGDLDWITMKAIEKDRTRRYGAASDLAADLRRHLENQPVLASPPSQTYRLGKFVRRNRVSVAAATVLVVLLAAFGVAMAIQAQRIANERDRANREAVAARQVSNFLVGLFKVSDPSEALGNALTAREILDSGAKKIEAELAGQPEVKARLMETMGTVYTNLGLYRGAEPLLREAVATNRRTLGNNHSQTLTAINQLANAYWFQDRYLEAEPLYLEVSEGRRQVLGEEHPDTLRVRTDLASLYTQQKRFDEAERLDKATLEVQLRVLGPDHPDTRLSWNVLQAIYFAQGRFADAEPIARRVVDTSHRHLGDDHPDTLIDMHNLATIYDRLARYAEAEPVYVKTINGKTRVLGAAHPSAVRTVMRLAQMYQKQERYDQAELQLLGAWDALSAAGGPGVLANSSASAAAVSTQLVKLYDAWGKPAKATEWRGKRL